MKPVDYESEPILHQYLLFHYGSADDQFKPWKPPCEPDFPGRCAAAALDVFGPKPPGCALDVGCAVGGASFALARRVSRVVGIDLSARFIESARQMKASGRSVAWRIDEGDLGTAVDVRVDPAIDRSRVSFEVGDACAASLREVGSFDLVLAANLIDRLPSPRAFLAAAPTLVRPGGLLVLMSPYTWLESFTPKANWLGGREAFGQRIETFATLSFLLKTHFTLAERRDLPFAIREHARKFQWSMADATFWRRKVS